MPTRSGEDYPPLLDDVFAKARSDDGETTSPFPVIDVMAAWGVWSTLSLEAPVIEHCVGTGESRSVLAAQDVLDGDPSGADPAAQRAAPLPYGLVLVLVLVLE